MTNGMSQPRRLYKSRSDRMLFGVCGGLAEYLDVDSTIVRLIMVLMVFFGGTGVLLYIAAAILMPKNPWFGTLNPEGLYPRRSPSVSGDRFAGLVLMLVGILLLFGNLGLYRILHFHHLGWGSFLALFLIVVGILFIVLHREGSTGTASIPVDPVAGETHEPRKRLERSIRDRKLFGVCGGLAGYLGVDSTIIRVLFVVTTVLSFGFGVLLYAALAIAAPEERFTMNT